MQKLKKRKYFGTDGIRTKAGEFPLTAEFVQKLGFSAGEVLKTKPEGCKVLIGRDTRESGGWIFEELCRGFNKAGFCVDDLVVVPTPCISLMVSKLNYCCGVMISASHNPYYDNGIKFFSSAGEKLTDEIELKIEEKIDGFDGDYETTEIYQQKIDGFEFYLNFCIENFKVDLTGLKIAIDCSNGSNFEFAPKILRKFGAEVTAIFAEPNGKNINDGCGSTHIETLVDCIKSGNFDIGFSFDGDGDRVIAVRNDGKVLDGDFLLGIIAKYLKSINKLRNNKLVLTVMSNLGLKIAMEEQDIDVVETGVGDRYVYKAMLSQDAVIGGEQSGHIILREHNNTGDGFLACLFMLEVLKDLGQEEFTKWTDEIKKYPQVLVNVKVKEKVDIEGFEVLRKAKQKIEENFNGKGRVLIRYSGTEPLLRIMIEGENQQKIKEEADKFAGLIKSVLG